VGRYATTRQTDHAHLTTTPPKGISRRGALPGHRP
jgi:hypothetical protein